MGESIQEEDLFEQALAEVAATKDAKIETLEAEAPKAETPPVEALKVEETSSVATPAAAGDNAAAGEDVINRIGQMTRMFHESLRGLGLDQMIEHVAHDIPDARERLNYVAKMTEQAAERVLNATDIASPLQDELSETALSIEERWKAVLASPSLKSEYNKAAEETLEFLQKTTKNTKETKDLLMEIMMAQDFQDLTGQVIKKITALAQDLEKQLVQVLVDYSPPAKKTEEGLLNGPQIDPTKMDVVGSQAQVDDLLDSLGF
jgi:chemotaxis protein CheZ